MNIRRSHMVLKPSFVLAFGLILLASLSLSSCQKTQEKSPAGGNIRIITTLFPLYDFTRSIGKDKVEVTLLLPPGVEAHAFEPKPADIARIHDADLFIYTGDAMEPWVAKILKGVQSPRLSVVDSSKGIPMVKAGTASEEEPGHDGHDHGGLDPHIWLDFDNAAKMIDTVTAGLIAKDTPNRDFYLKNAREYQEQLKALDNRYRTALATCKKNVIVYAGHASVGYLMRRYHIQFATAYKGFSPDTEPTPRDLAKMVNIIKKNGLRYIYYEELISPKIARIISGETGAEMLLLNGAHNISKQEYDSGVSYLGLMDANLKNLIKGMECRPQTSSP